MHWLVIRVNEVHFSVNNDLKPCMTEKFEVIFPEANE